MIFGPGSPEDVPARTGGPRGRHAPRTGAAPSMYSAEPVKRKNAAVVKRFARPG